MTNVTNDRIDKIVTVANNNGYTGGDNLLRQAIQKLLIETQINEMTAYGVIIENYKNEDAIDYGVARIARLQDQLNTLERE